MNSEKTVGVLVVAGVALVLGVIGFVKTLHVNNVQDIQVIQDVSGKISVRREGGWYVKLFPRIWTYPKACNYYFSDDAQQSKDHDAPKVRYANTGTGSLNCQVLYRIDLSDDETIIKLHEWAHGDDAVIEQRVLSTLTTLAQSAASKINSTDAIKQYDKYYMDIRRQFVGNEELKKQGIFVEDFVLAGEPGFDTKTRDLFLAQQTADLMKQTAEAEKLKLISEREKTIAQYEKEQAENEGKAKAQMAKEVTDAERVKKLAEIAAEQKVAVEKLEKEQMLVKASKELEVAKITKETEEKQLEIIKVKASQRVAEAEAKQIAIAKSGAITEVQLAEIELQRQIAEYKWKAIGEGLSFIELPSVLTIGGEGSSGGGSGSPIDNFINVLMVEKLDAIGASKAKTTVAAPALAEKPADVPVEVKRPGSKSRK